MDGAWSGDRLLLALALEIPKSPKVDRRYVSAAAREAHHVGCPNVYKASAIEGDLTILGVVCSRIAVVCNRRYVCEFSERVYSPGRFTRDVRMLQLSRVTSLCVAGISHSLRYL